MPPPLLKVLFFFYGEIQSTNSIHQSYFIHQVSRAELKPGTRVTLDMTTLTIMRILPREVDPLVYHMAAEDPGKVCFVSLAAIRFFFISSTYDPVLFNISTCVVCVSIVVLCQSARRRRAPRSEETWAQHATFSCNGLQNHCITVILARLAHSFFG